MIDRGKGDEEPVFETVDDLAKRARSLLSRLEEKEQEFSTQLETVRKHAEEASANIEQIRQVEQSGRTLQDEAETLKLSLEEDRATIADLAGQARRLLAELTDRKKEIAELGDEATRLRARVEELLPGATSAGLASAFRERKRALRAPRRTWGAVFVLAVLSLVLVGYIDPLTFEPNAPDYRALLPYLLERLPLIIPMVLLAIYAGIRHRQALRLEEEYAYKEALAQSFAGFKQQLLEIDADDPEKRHTLDLIRRMLDALELHPGHVYLGRRAGRAASEVRRDASPDKPPTE